MLDERIEGYYERSILANMEHGVNVIQQSEPVLKKFLKAGKIEVESMLYDINTGKIKVLEKIKK